MKRILIASLLISLPTLAYAQSAADLRNAANTPDKVLTYGMSYSQQRFSRLTQINKQTVRRLVPAWAYSLDDSNKEESQALVMDGVLYITAHDKTVAINVETGKEIWQYDLGKVAAPLRGVTYWQGDKDSPPLILAGTSDGRLLITAVRSLNLSHFEYTRGHEPQQRALPRLMTPQSRITATAPHRNGERS